MPDEVREHLVTEFGTATVVDASHVTGPERHPDAVGQAWAISHAQGEDRPWRCRRFEIMPTGNVRMTRFGEYRTRRLVLAAYNRLAQAQIITTTEISRPPVPFRVTSP
ncbi:hypothetical protein Mnod_0930 [Methylobacterium nodulans ORS 2060]|uniref:Uncharacterized protein n=1 Tax=Methylobacterium nodulans (strain LMG 21967 / CNCM I-2342 / ORS 2060) TaxID=460265 RepID=B8IGP8_METNO|nr:hypothetical protein Mnod_0930 [Methylobacterium nodulans ORS 2060]